MLNYKINGHGEKAIIFVHGNSQSLHTWDRVTQQKIHEDYTLIALDLPGHGLSFRSNQPEIDYSARGLAANLNAFLAAINKKDFILVGTSLGTSIIAELNPFPPYCKGCFLCGAMLTSANITVKDMIQQGTSVTAAFKGNPTDEEIEYLIDHFLFNSNPYFREHYKMVFKQTDPNLRETLGKSLKQPPTTNKIAKLVSANVPIAIAYGAKERIVQTDYLEKTDLRFWKNKILKIEDAGHCIELDQPAELADLISAFASDCFQ